MLNFKSVSAKNFLSYGDVWTEVDLYKGINLVTGFDNQKKRSNGAGKTSFMEMIIFALFGQISKGLKQSQIINWKNKKKCETKCVFYKDNHEYIFHRGLKPNFLKVFKDGNEFPINSSIKDFQIECEEQILGMDFKTFNSLIYSNPNNSISILDTPKPQKRAFIEKQFNLTEFTELNNLNNDSIRETEKEKNNLEEQKNSKITLIESFQNDINDINNDISKIDTEKIENDINNLKESLFDIKINQETIDKIEKRIKDEKINEKHLKDEIKIKTDEKNVIKEDLISVVSTISTLKKQKKDIGDISEYIKKAENIKKKLNLFDDNIDNDIKVKKEAIIEFEKNLKELNDTYIDHTSIIKELKSKINSYNLGIKKGETKCPTCFQDVDYDVIKKTIDKKIEDYQFHIDNEIETRSIVENGINEHKKSIKKIKDGIEFLEKRKEDKNNKEKELYKLQSYIDKEQDIKKIDQEINTLSKKLSKKKYLENISNEVKKLENKLENKEKIIFDLDTKLTNYYNDIKKKTEISNKIDILNERLQNQLNNLTNYKKNIELKEANIKKYEKECININDKIKYLNDNIEHFKFVKEMLKDNNIKQFAISHMIPIIEKHVNYYLGEAGFTFYLKLDNWLDAEIKGPGISDCSFASMSGGERKSIDLALKFAIMDISVARNPYFPNILILDELLDSSVDSLGIKQLIDVVKVKQKKNNLKVYIISHRQEMDDLEPDHIYTVLKDKGFSKIIFN
jgi:DNA repair exonuclease SbcCD ATPase subunit